MTNHFHIQKIPASGKPGKEEELCGTCLGPSLQGSSQENIDWGPENQFGPPGGSLERHPFLWYLHTSLICNQKHADINHINWAWWYCLLILVLERWRQED